jgi:hypothetical protein
MRYALWSMVFYAGAAGVPLSANIMELPSKPLAVALFVLAEFWSMLAIYVGVRQLQRLDEDPRSRVIAYRYMQAQNKLGLITLELIICVVASVFETAARRQWIGGCFFFAAIALWNIRQLMKSSMEANRPS